MIDEFELITGKLKAIAEYNDQYKSQGLLIQTDPSEEGDWYNIREPEEVCFNMVKDLKKGEEITITVPKGKKQVINITFGGRTIKNDVPGKETTQKTVGEYKPETLEQIGKDMEWCLKKAMELIKPYGEGGFVSNEALTNVADTMFIQYYRCKAR